jgi:ubiquinone/menaquinone biosynthesis C-methylase UbiE
VATDQEDPMWLAWQKRAPAIYDKVYYNTNPIVTYINRYGHVWLEKMFTEVDHFDNVIEIGAGTGEHLDFVRHSFNTYYISDINSAFLDKSKQRYENNSNIKYVQQDARNISFLDDTFDRLISIYTLEHLLNPHLALKEWKRVVKKNGIISIVIPTEGGVFWNLGRFLTTRRYFKKLGLDLDYIIAREHINACYRLVYFINYFFPQKYISWFPFRFSFPGINLIYACNAINV